MNVKIMLYDVFYCVKVWVQTGDHCCSKFGSYGLTGDDTIGLVVLSIEFDCNSSIHFMGFH